MDDSSSSPSSSSLCSSNLYGQGAHVTINARSEMDLDEDTVLDKVAKASGANFSFHKEKAKPMPEAGPVVGQRSHISLSLDLSTSPPYYCCFLGFSV